MPLDKSERWQRETRKYGVTGRFSGSCARANCRRPPKTTVFNILCSFVLFCAFACMCWKPAASRAQAPQDSAASQSQVSDAERAGYAEALTYCRKHTALGVILSDDKRVVCINEHIFTSVDLATVNSLAQGGIAVVRSLGGEIATTMQIADLLLIRQATVVINGYCLGNCANYLFLASLKTFVPKDSLVAWTVVNDANECFRFSKAEDRGAPRVELARCTGGSHDDSHHQNFSELKRKFYLGRVLAGFDDPPESLTIRRILKRKYDETGIYPSDFYWTWNPRLYASKIRTKVVYEAYPSDQEAVDAIVAGFGLRETVIYDP